MNRKDRKMNKLISILLAFAMIMQSVSGTVVLADDTQPEILESTQVMDVEDTEEPEEVQLPQEEQPQETEGPDEAAKEEADASAPEETQISGETEISQETQIAEEGQTEEIFTDHPMADPVPTAEEGLTEINLSTVSVEQVYLLTNAQFVSTSAGDILTGTGNGYRLTGSGQDAGARTVYVGDNTYSGTSYSGGQDISVDLADTGSELSVLQIQPIVKGEGFGTVMLSVSSSSRIGTLRLMENAQAVLTLSDALEIGNIELAAGSSLQIRAGSYALNVTGNTTGSGSVILSGSSLTFQGLDVKSITLDNAVLNAMGGRVTATDSLTVNNSTVQNASLLGFNEEVTGARTLTFTGSGNELHNIAAVGTTETGKANVTITGAETISNASDTNYFCDYGITYLYNGTELTKEDTWPDTYRVKYTGTISGTGTITGYHQASGTYVAETGQIQLPVYEQKGYSCQGWTLGEDTTVNTVLPSGYASDLVLNAVMEAASVTVTVDLGYTPNENSNDDYDTLEKVTTHECIWGDVVTLTTPYRFGYVFQGWKIATAGEDSALIKDSYTVSLEDAQESEDGAFSIALEAVWTADDFPIRFLISSNVDLTKLKVQTDESTVYDSVSAFAQSNPSVIWNEADHLLEFATIVYGEKLSDYLTRIGLSQLPVLLDQREGAEKQEFAGWSTPAGAMLSEDMTFSVGSILDNKAEGESLVTYESKIKSIPVLLTSLWGTGQYKLTVDVADGWELLVNGEVQTPNGSEKTMTLSVATGSELVWRCSATNPLNFSRWTFTEGFLPEETTYDPGARYLTWKAVMPYKNITANYVADLSTLYIDLAVSKITFEQNVTMPNGRTVDGFWYTEMMLPSEYSGMKANALSPAFQADASYTGHENEYFYIWNFSDAFRITSKNVYTKNQLTLVSAMTVTLRDCKMEATDAYRDNAVGTKLGGIELENLSDDQGGSMSQTLAGQDLTQYANVILNTDTTNQYTVTLNLKGDNNVIADISTSGFHSETKYGGTVVVQGIDSTGNSKAELGTIFGDFACTIQNLDVTAYEKETPFNYLTYTSRAGSVRFYTSNINAKESTVFTYSSYLNVVNSQFYVKEVRGYYYGITMSGSTYAHIYGDVLSNRHSMSVTGDASVVVDGNVMTTSQDQYATGDINTTGYVIVKGTVYDSANTRFTNGTVICNTLIVGSYITTNGSARLITNLITGNTYSMIRYDASAGRYYPDPTSGSRGVGTIARADQNEDDYPFRIFSSNAPTTRTYDFGGSSTRIYLFGYYGTTQVDGVEYYDPAITALSQGNPIASYVLQCLDDKGDLNSGVSLNDTELQNAVSSASASYGNNECIMLGNSTYTPNTSTPRYAAFTGAQVYATGNITFFNETTVSAGTIQCGGSFGTKSDLAVSGGSITAKSVGNVYHLTTAYTDGTKRWKKTIITGGTIDADVIGARNSHGTKGSKQRSLVEVTGGTIQGKTTLQSDEYINYIYDETDFPEASNTFGSMPDNVRLSADYVDGSTEVWSTEGCICFTPPVASDGSTGSWTYGALSGPEAEGIGAEGSLLPVTTGINVSKKDQLLLYAAKDKYNLTKVYGTDLYTLNTKDTSAVFTSNTMTDISDLQQIQVETASVSGGTEVSLTVNDESYRTRTVVWYIDGNGQYHNALAGENWNGNSITFDMPKGNTYIYVVDDAHALPLDLWICGYSFDSNGFVTQLADTDNAGKLVGADEDKVFTYSGNYRIVQSNLKINQIAEDGNAALKGVDSSEMTGNRIRFASDFDNQTTTRNQIVFSRVYQKCQDDQFGVLVESSSDGSEGAKVGLQIDGKVALFRFQLKTPSSLALVGVNGAGTDVFYFNRAQTNSPSEYLISVGTTAGKTGDLTLENLKFNFKSGYGGHLLRGTDRGGSLTIKNCTFTNNLWGDSTGFARNIKDVTIQRSTINITNSYSYTTQMFDGCGNVTVSDGSQIQWKAIGSESTGGYPFDYGISGTLTVDNSEIITTFDSSADRRTLTVNDFRTTKAQKVILKNGAVYTADSRLWFVETQVLDNSVLTVRSNGNEDSYFISRVILVDGGTINADYVVVSGFYSPPSNAYSSSTKAALDERISKGDYTLNGYNYLGLEIKSGTVNAKKFAGGDWSGKVTVSGGELNTAAVGTSGYLYGFIKPLPANKLDYVYKYPIYNYSNYSQSATVTVDGGTVNITDGGYLGGANTKVRISGGQVKLGTGATLGMTQEQTKTLSDYYSAKGDSIGAHAPANSDIQISGGIVVVTDGTTGSIRAPYGQLRISGAGTSIKVAEISADYGTVEIKDANKAFENPYKGTEQSKYRSDNIGVWVTDSLSAQDLTITSGAQVYAPNAFAQVTDGKGRLTVQEAGLYSDAYGEKGVSRAENDKLYNDTANAVDQTVFGTHLVSITYVLNPQGILTDADEKLVENNNPANYTSTATDRQLKLQDAFCEGYYFRGWYSNPECTGNASTVINTTIANDFTLYAKWEKVRVKFQLVMDQSSASGYYSTEEFNGNSHWTPSQDGNSYVSTEMAYVTYGDRILTASGVNLINYSTNTLGVTEVQIQEDSYTGDKTISATSIVSKALAEYYKTKDTNGDGSAVITLHVHMVQKRYATITFDLNQKNGRPVDAGFNSKAASIRENVGVDKTLGTIPAFADATVTEGKSKGLVQAAATGYTFFGWNTDKDATKDSTDGWVNADSIFTANTTIYAIWQVNTYKVKFAAGEGSWVTADGQAPSVGQVSVPYLEYYWVYDTPVTEANSFWYVDAQGSHYMTELPYAWKEGSTFDNENGWFYSYDDNGTTIKEKISSAKALSKLLIRALDVTLGSPYGNPSETALTVTAEYTPVKVTYDLNGGHWTDSTQTNTQNPAYGDPLAGYHTEDADSTTQVLESTTGENGTTYRVLGTTAAHYNTNKTYAATDYRNLLSRKGYTFLGWYTSLEDAAKAEAYPASIASVGTTPRFTDVNLYAAWKANSYQVDLYSKEDSRTYNYTSFNTVNPVNGISVTVGQTINSSEWPGRNGNWYAYNSSTQGTPEENAKRFFLGGTFAALDPGTTDQTNSAGYKTYQNYAEAVTAMSNSGTLYQSGSSLFFLPEDDAYSKDITANYGSGYSVPDYPDGSTISMYAVYRERSLVFVERYIDPAGQEQQTIKYSGPWNVWSDYPIQYGTAGNSQVTRQGYSLVGWYVNGTTTSAPVYPSTKEAYAISNSLFKATAEQLGTYDIMVYTVYAAQVERNVTMNSKTDPVTTDLTVDSYTLPASMQNGKVTMSLSMGNPALQLVSKEEMEAHAYDSTWTTGGVQYSAENTAALLVTISKGTDTKTMDLSKAVNDTLDFGKEMEAGWQITLTLYHSKVISADNTYTFDLKVNFASSGSGENTLKDQFINNHVSIRLQPTIYTVNYSVKLPEKAGQLTVGSWGDFTQPDGTDAVEVTKQVKQAYGSDLISNLIQIEGYEPASDLWIYNSEAAAYTKAVMKVSAANNGQIEVALSYKAKTWRLTADADTLKYWTIKYGDGVGSTAMTELTRAGADVKYHSDIRFTPKGTGYAYAPEFVTITRTPDGQDGLQEKLPDYAQKAADGSYYGVQMNAAALDATYVTVMTMYLEEGTITLTPDAYTQERAEGTVTKTWPGTYVVLQNRQNSGANATANRLIAKGDLDGRDITLGNLNISSDNSVELTAGTKATLTLAYGGKASSLTGKNILAAEGSDVQLKGSDAAHGTISMTPEVGDAAIGGTAAHPVNGKLTLTELDVSLNMPAGSSASGIGAAADGTGAGDISISDCTVNVSEGSDVDVYSGAWIGGKDVQNVDLSNVTLVKTGDKHMAGPSITNGKNVTLDSCRLGSADKSLTDPVYGEDTLTIRNSEVYLNIQDNISGKDISAPVGSSSTGSVTVTGSIVKAICSGNGINGISDLYTGILYITDAKSDVNISGTQILEMTNGSVKIIGNSYTQASEIHAADNARRNYLLIQEGTKTGTSDLAVSQISGTLEVRKPKNTANTSVDAGNLTIETNTQLQLKGMLTVSGIATVSANTAITAKAEDHAGITFTGSNVIFANAKGSSYTQEGGILNASGTTSADGTPVLVGSFGDGIMDITLKKVTATVTSLYAKDLTIQGGSATASGGFIGSKPSKGEVTTVTLTDTFIVAPMVGALGTYGETFTSVTETNTSRYGVLVQDHYRINYDVNGTRFTTDNLGKVLRTEQNRDTSTGTLGAITIKPDAGVPGAPGNDTSNIFAGWYINQNGQRTALVKDGDPLPAGLTASTTLSGTTINTADAKDVSDNTDGTKTLTVHVWLLATGTTAIKSGRVFADFTDGTTSVTIQTNQAWTARLASTGTSIQGRDYKAAFSSALPAGTKLTLTVPKTADSAGKYYYYIVPSGGTSSVNFSQFTVMGGTSKFQTTTYTDNAPDEEVFLLSADFAGTSISNATSSRSVSFTLLPDSTGTSSISMGTAVTYSYTTVTQGNVSARMDSAGGQTLEAEVKTWPIDSANLIGQNLYLMAELKTENGGDVSVSYRTKAEWNGQTGIWISKDKVLFPVSAVTSNQTVTFTDLPGGTYTMNWCLVYGKDPRGNIAGNKVSNTASFTYTNTVLTDRPLLDVVLNPKVDSYVIPQGTQTKLQFHLETSCNQSETDKVVSITIEKQDTLCNFIPVDENSAGFVVWKGTLIHQATTSTREDAVTFTSAVAPGTYRICFSMDPGSTEDNVYFTFIVK